jgi:cytoskeletal protein RodZ
LLVYFFVLFVYVLVVVVVVVFRRTEESKQSIGRSSAPKQCTGKKDSHSREENERSASRWEIAAQAEVSLSILPECR